MVEIQIIYNGELRCAATHAPSQSVVLTDAPVDNQGKGESFSPTDLIATALGTCMLTVIGIAAKGLNLDLTGSRVTVVKEMVAKPKRRIGKLSVTIAIAVAVDAEQKEKLIDAAMTCPVHASLHPEVQTPIDFIWATDFTEDSVAPDEA